MAAVGGSKEVIFSSDYGGFNSNCFEIACVL